MIKPLFLLALLLLAACGPTPVPAPTGTPVEEALDFQFIRAEDVPAVFEPGDPFELALQGVSAGALGATPPYSDLTLGRPKDLTFFRADTQTLLGVLAYPLTQADAALVDTLLADPVALGQAFAGTPEETSADCTPLEAAPGVTAAACLVNTQDRAEGAIEPQRLVAAFRQGAALAVLQSLYDESQPVALDTDGFLELAAGAHGRLVEAVQSHATLAAPRLNVSGGDAAAQALAGTTQALTGWPAGYADSQQPMFDFTDERLRQFGPRLRSYSQVAKPEEAIVQLYVIYPLDPVEQATFDEMLSRPAALAGYVILPVLASRGEPAPASLEDFYEQLPGAERLATVGDGGNAILLSVGGLLQELAVVRHGEALLVTSVLYPPDVDPPVQAIDQLPVLDGIVGAVLANPANAGAIPTRTPAPIILP
jgi:hypothetical protein